MEYPSRQDADHRGRAIFFLILAAILWSTSGLFIKIIDWKPLSILSGRSLVSSVVFWLYLRPVALRWSKIEVLGTVNYALAQLFFIMATKWTTAANAIFLQFTLPIHVMLLGYWFLGERPQRADWMAIVVIFAGMGLFFGDDLNMAGMTGNAMGVLSGMTYAILILCLRKQKNATPSHIIFLGTGIGVTIGLPSLLTESVSP